MKKILLIVLAASAFAACKKNHVITPNGELFGRWELHSRIGGNIIPQDTTYKPGNGNIYQFNPDSTYKSYTDGTLSRSGVFHTTSVSNYQMKAMPIEYLYFDSDTSFKYEITISGATLTFLPLMPDIGTTQYTKIAN